MIHTQPDLILFNGKITTFDIQQPEVSAIGIKDGIVSAIGSDEEIKKLAKMSTPTIDLKKRRVIPGLNDSHLHLIRGGLNYNMELRWDGVPSLAYALGDVERTSSSHASSSMGKGDRWLVESFNLSKNECRHLKEINAIAPDTPVFILHLYDRALLNAAALRAVGYTKDTPDPIGGRIERDKNGNPTGMLIAEPNAMILYATLAKGPKLIFCRSNQLHTSFYARTQSAWPDKLHRCRRRLSKLS